MVSQTSKKSFPDFLVKNILYVIACLFLIAVYIVYIAVFAGATEDTNFQDTIVISNSTNTFCLVMAVISLVVVIGFLGIKMLNYFY